MDIVFDEVFEVRKGDIIETIERQYFIITAYDSKEDRIEIKSLITTYTVAEYDSIEELNRDVRRGYFENKHTGNNHIKRVIPREEVLMTRK